MPTSSRQRSAKRLLLLLLSRVKMGAREREEDYTESSRSKIKYVCSALRGTPHAHASLDDRFAPLVVPRHRRLQTFAVFGWTIALPFMLGCFFLLW